MSQVRISSFEQSRKLWDLGFRPDRFEESAFVWSQNKNCKDLVIESHVSQKPQSFCDVPDIWIEYPAYIIIDVIERLPWVMDFNIDGVCHYFCLDISKGEEIYLVQYLDTDDESFKYKVFENEQLTIAVIDMFIWLLEEKLIVL